MAKFLIIALALIAAAAADPLIWNPYTATAYSYPQLVAQWPAVSTAAVSSPYTAASTYPVASQFLPAFSPYSAAYAAYPGTFDGYSTLAEYYLKR